MVIHASHEMKCTSVTLATTPTCDDAYAEAQALTRLMPRGIARPLTLGRAMILVRALIIRLP